MAHTVPLQTNLLRVFARCRPSCGFSSRLMAHGETAVALHRAGSARHVGSGAAAHVTALHACAGLSARRRSGMRVRRFRVMAALLLVSAAAQLRAADVIYPPAAPRFTVSIPETWKPVFGGRSLTLLPIPEDGFVIQIDQHPAAAEDLLDELTEQIAAQMQFTEVKLGKASEAENQHDIDCTMMTSTGRSADVDVVVTVVAFTVEHDTETHFTLQAVGPAALTQKHKTALLGVIDSIKPLKK